MDARSLAEKVRALILDVDGVLTDGGLYYDAEGRISKRFNVQDGLGVKLAQAAGVEVAVISGLASQAVETRVRELGIEHYHGGRIEKIPLLKDFSDKTEIPLEAVAYLGDDWVDAGAMRMVGLPMAVANAQPEIKRLAAYVTTAAGGHGAVREAIRFILESQGRLKDLWREWSLR